jgi:hypothetical protein
MEELKACPQDTEASDMIKRLRLFAFHAEHPADTVMMGEAADILERLLAEKQNTDAHLKAINDSLSKQLRRAAPENKPEGSEKP